MGLGDSVPSSIPDVGAACDGELPMANIRAHEVFSCRFGPAVTQSADSCYR